MKLIGLYIENFGGLSRYELQFQPGLTTINEPNGFGKTTLAEFIRAMLYGFPRKVKTLGKSKRQKYAPWNGGQYGGNLVFEHENRRFRLERTFGTTPKGDTFTLIDLATNRKSDRFSEEIGIELFGLDSDAFERSTYLPQMHEDGALSTASIQAKLSNLVEDSGDIGNFDRAIDALKAKRSALIPFRGSGGTVARADNMISQLQLQLDGIQLKETQLTAAQEDAVRTEREIEEKRSALAQLREELAVATEMAAAAAQQRQYAALQERFRQAAAQAQDYQNQYPVGFPDDQALNHAEALADRLAVMTAQKISTEEVQRLQAVLQENARFETHLPTREELDDWRKKCEDYEAQQTKIRNAQQQMAQLMQAERQQQTTDHNAQTKGTLIAAVVALIIGVAGVVAGAAMLYLQEFVFGYLGLGIGAAMLLTGTLLLLDRRKKRLALEETLAAQRKLLDEQIAAARQEITALQQSGEQCGDRIAAFLAEFSIAVPPTHFLAALTELEHRAAQYAQAKAQLERSEQCETALEALRQQLQAFFAQYGLTMAGDIRTQLRQIRTDTGNVQTAQDLALTLKQQLGEMEETCGGILSAELGAAADPQLLKIRERQLNEALTEQTTQLLRLQQRVRELRADCEKYPQLQEELENWTQRKKQDRENARTLDDTIEFLQKARENLSTSYLGIIQSRFGYYLSELEGITGDKFLIDTDLQVQLERLGQSRELAYFSAGQTDLVMLCMRLALVDALFDDQEVFIILDDPFVNLDDTHTADALKLLQTLGNEKQILYLTCHSSRTL